MMHLVCLSVVICSTLISGQTTAGPNTLSPCPGDENGCHSPNYPEPYENESCFCSGKVDPGYQLELVVEHLNLNGDTKDNLIIKTDEKEEKKIILIRFLNEEKRFLLPGSVYIEFFSNSKNTNTGFKVHWKPYGELATTTEPPTTAIEWPKPTANDSIYYTVYLSNTTAKEFAEKQLSFRFFMASITEPYCKAHNISLAENVTVENVIIDLAIQCPIQWPDSKHCVEVRYAIPVFLKEDSELKGYELKAENLEQMWLELGVAKVKDLGYTIYEEPDNNYYLILWLSVSVITAGLFFIILFGFRSFGIRFAQKRRRQSDTEQIVPSSKRVSDASLWPMSQQVVPPLFDTRYNVYFEPDMNTTNVSSMQNSASKMMELDDMSDEDILDVTHISSPSAFTKKYITLSDDPTATESAT